ncbi:MAG: tRNA (N6-isopentenyl adenosine(37)-C2)-methylthiotransferase MiaB [Actinobacteria bacterium ATB1]|nr:tRNA (N6-isopentenyl adenosine(37)-C2)-methylthiotransferase MiaB [Actinobacteria bacterium ATB1]
MPGRYLLRTFGCQMNEHDSERIAGVLEERGLEQADSAENADLVVFNTCCIRDNADQRLYGQLGQLASEKAKRPDMKIAVGGCLAQKDGARLLERSSAVDLVFGTHNVARLPELLDLADVSDGPVLEILEETEVLAAALPASRRSPFSAWVTISVGCDNSCTFCIVPSVRGREVSRAATDIVDECERLASDGVVEVTLLGQNVNSYGRDLDGRRPLFADLLRSVDAVEGIGRIRFTSPHPKDLRPETIEAMAECASVCEQLHLPVQSGSDRILAAMHRGYRAGRYLERIEDARRSIPGLTLSTDIIVGFPGETEADFQATLDLVEAARFDSAFTFIYSPRPGTAAAGMNDPVPPEEKRERYARLTELVDSIAWSKNLDLVGRPVEILVEGPSKKDPSKISGRTRGGKLVHVSDDDRIRAGDVVTVLVGGAASHYLTGDLAL